jgi:enoyl-CoA hydratase/carnithine racemase
MSGQGAQPLDAAEGVFATLAGGVWEIRLSRPDKKNALTLEMFSQLAAALARGEQDEAVKAILVHGDGGSFTAGHDLKAFGQWPQQASDPFPTFLAALARLRKPLVAAVEGVGVGIGCTLLLHADWVCCTGNARLRLPFIELGIGPELASSLLLPQTIGLMRAKRLLYGAEVFSGEQAYEWGLVSELVDAAALLDRARERAEFLAGRPPASFAAIKAFLQPEGEGERLSRRLHEEVEFINEVVRRRQPFQ